MRQKVSLCGNGLRRKQNESTKKIEYGLGQNTCIGNLQCKVVCQLIRQCACTCMYILFYQVKPYNYTHYHMIHTFKDPQKEALWKTCSKRKKFWLQAFSPAHDFCYPSTTKLNIWAISILRSAIAFNFNKSIIVQMTGNSVQKYFCNLGDAMDEIKK